MVKEFSYTSSTGTKDRKVFVMKDTGNSIAGIDLNLLSASDASTITSMYKDFTPVTDNSTPVLEGFNPAWNKAYRQFSKSKMIAK